MGSWRAVVRRTVQLHAGHIIARRRRELDIVERMPKSLPAIEARKHLAAVRARRSHAWVYSVRPRRLWIWPVASPGSTKLVARGWARRCVGIIQAGSRRIADKLRWLLWSMD